MALKEFKFVTTAFVFSVSTLGVAGDFQDGGDIQTAIDNAVDGQVILIPAGVYPVYETIDLGGKEIILQGEVDKAGVPTTMLDGGDAVRIMECVSGETVNTRIRNLVLTAGLAENGGAMRVVGSAPSLENCVFLQNNSVDQSCSPCFRGHVADPANGGALWIDGGSPSFTDCRFIENTGRYGGAIYADGSELLMENVEFKANTGEKTGGAFYCTDGGLEIDGGLFKDNSSEYEAGALYFGASDFAGNNLLLTSVEFVSNRTTFNGGAAIIGSTGDVTLDGVTCKSNEAGGRGGALYCSMVNDGVFQMRESLLETNTSGSTGGAVFIKSHTLVNPLFDRCRMENNVSQNDGSAVFYADVIEVRDSVVCGNQVLPQIAPDAIWIDLGGNCIREECCLADFDCNGKVDGGDLARLLGDWDGSDVFYDINGSGVVDGADLAYLLGTWGDCP